MNDLKQMIVSMLSSNSSLVSLLGVTVTDPRIYYYYNGEADISEDSPGYITYTMLSSPETSRGVNTPVFSLRVWALSNEHASKISDAMKEMWDKKEFSTVGTPEFPSRTVRGRLVNSVDVFQEQPNYAGVDCHYRFSDVDIP